MKCVYCKAYGHDKEDCRKRLNIKMRTNPIYNEPFVIQRDVVLQE
ncbi:hypothetical protein K1T71_014715 [Dendrolimus kikuchii]|nr:hypothetical protein K1T71_014715 [Dendrolimus kikuchii]